MFSADFSLIILLWQLKISYDNFFLHFNIFLIIFLTISFWQFFLTILSVCVYNKQFPPTLAEPNIIQRHHPSNSSQLMVWWLVYYKQMVSLMEVNITYSRHYPVNSPLIVHWSIVIQYIFQVMILWWISILFTILYLLPCKLTTLPKIHYIRNKNVNAESDFNPVLLTEGLCNGQLCYVCTCGSKND